MWLGIVSDLVAVAAADAVHRTGLGEIESVGDVEEYVAAAVTGFLSQYGPVVAKELVRIVEPAAKKAAEIVGPVVEQKLKEQVPVFAAVTGGLIGISVIAGVFIGRAARRYGW